MLKIAQGICVFALAASGLMAQTTAPVQEVGTTGMVGVTEGQYAHFNILNPGVVLSTVPPPATAAACTALLSFIGDDGGVLKTKTVTVNPGTSQSIDIYADADLALAIGARKELRATFTTPPAIPVASATVVAAPCALIGTLEIIDVLSLKTQVVLGGIHAVPGSAPLH
jgi:hypothetical protein